MSVAVSLHKGTYIFHTDLTRHCSLCRNERCFVVLHFCLVIKIPVLVLERVIQPFRSLLSFVNWNTRKSTSLDHSYSFEACNFSQISHGIVFIRFIQTIWFGAPLRPVVNFQRKQFCSGVDTHFQCNRMWK